MASKEIIVPATEPTDWRNPIVDGPKTNGDIRICMDPRNLNKYVKRELFHILTYDNLLSQLSGAKYFTLLNASSAFLQIPTIYESSLLCTITITFGRYRYLQLPYGLTSSPEMFQHYIHEVLDELWHHDNLNIVLTKVKHSGLTLNKEKSVFCVNKIKFLEHLISADGISPDENKTRAISNMKPIKNKKELQRFLGMVVYLAQFIPNLSQESSILRRLLSDKIEWIKTQTEESCFKQIKQLGLCAMISQDNKQTEFASISLTQTQQKYNQIEKELLALVFGCERFNFYLFGQNFNIETDHQQLLGLLKKPLDEMSPRIQRLAISLLRYQFKPHYFPGKNLKVPDTLINLRVFSVVTTSKASKQRLQEAINKDMKLQEIKYYVLNGWPSHKSTVPSELKKYWPIKNDIFLHQNILFYQKRLLVSEVLRKKFFDIIHQFHQGVVSCKRKAQEAIYYLDLKAIKNKKDPFIAVLDYNSTPKQNLQAPSVLLMGRRIRTTLPTSTALLQPLYLIEKLKRRLERNKIKQKLYYDRSSRKLPELHTGQPLLIQEKIRN
ncbi:hypothetical protein ILUMI_11501 [Ignelater luminosus]|uniref:Reverse transcriptase domain-containing protein n=1 Tax=Ignelater luminosus TaxID=2038154 RepID=A0A8K0GCN2_IGNLU|nr:hypothetical protein ILUMI_11501 [Ignelater luminosus]